MLKNCPVKIIPFRLKYRLQLGLFYTHRIFFSLIQKTQMHILSWKIYGPFFLYAREKYLYSSFDSRKKLDLVVSVLFDSVFILPGALFTKQRKILIFYENLKVSKSQNGFKGSKEM